MRRQSSLRIHQFRFLLFGIGLPKPPAGATCDRTRDNLRIFVQLVMLAMGVSAFAIYFPQQNMAVFSISIVCRSS